MTLIKMSNPIQLETPRLILRPWQEHDFAAFAQLNADPEVMRYFPAPLSRIESDELAHKIQQLIEQNGWGFWAVELKQTQQFIGFVGLHDQPTLFSFSPCVEIGWRLARAHWQHSYATEAAKACLDFAFNTLQLTKVVAFTAQSNRPSEKVMHALGMTFAKTFIHPKLDPSHPLALHLLYQIQRNEFNA